MSQLVRCDGCGRYGDVLAGDWWIVHPPRSVDWHPRHCCSAACLVRWVGENVSPEPHSANPRREETGG